jgi:hypothetical protein
LARRSGRQPPLALGHINSVYPLNHRVDLPSIPAAHAAFQDPARFLSQAVARPSEQLDATEGEVYHEHWRVRDAQLFGRPMPPELDPDIVYERRYALSWVVGFGEDWDDVPTDT